MNDEFTKVVLGIDLLKRFPRFSRGQCSHLVSAGSTPVERNRRPLLFEQRVLGMLSNMKKEAEYKSLKS